MNTVRDSAFRLRVAGHSYNEIKKALKIPKSTLSGWFKHVVLSDNAKVRLALRTRLGSAVLIKRNKMQTHRAQQRARAAQLEGMSRVHQFQGHELLLLGAALYWAEGYKRLMIRDGKERMGHVISFLNADSQMISVFVNFLYQCLDVPPEKIRLTMRLYPHINESEARRYWMRATGLPSICFQRTTMMVSSASKGKRPFNRLPFGTLQVAVNDTRKFHNLLGLIEGVKERALHVTVTSLLG